jgi:hypothetical protein
LVVGGGGVCLREISCQSTAPTQREPVLTMVKLLEWDQGHARGHVMRCGGGGEEVTDRGIGRGGTDNDRPEFKEAKWAAGWGQAKGHAIEACYDRWLHWKGNRQGCKWDAEMRRAGRGRLGML